jgi:hypothetical protein
VSGLSTRSGDLGTVDAFSHGFGLGDPVANPEQETSGTSGSFVFTGSVRTWQQPQLIAATDELDLTLTNIATVTIDPHRARIGCDADLHVMRCSLVACEHRRAGDLGLCVLPRFGQAAFLAAPTALRRSRPSGRSRLPAAIPADLWRF